MTREERARHMARDMETGTFRGTVKEYMLHHLEAVQRETAREAVDASAAYVKAQIERIREELARQREQFAGEEREEGR